MNRRPIIILFILMLLNAYLHLSAQVGCLDNSWNLQTRFDYKEYHPVSCNCPCWKYKQSPDRCKCVKCGHYHDQRNVLDNRPHWSRAQAVSPRTRQEIIGAQKKIGTLTLPTLYSQFMYAQE